MDSPVTPWWMYVAGVLGAAGLGAAAAYPKSLLALMVLGIVGTLLIGAVRSPWIALAVIIAQYPVLNTLRTIYAAHGLPVFAGGVRFFPDLLQLIIIAQILVLAIKFPRYRLKIYGDDLPVLVYVIVGIYSVVVAVQYIHPYGSLNGWYVSMTPAVFYLVLRWLQPTDAQSRWLFRWMTGCYVVLMSLSFYAYVVRPDWYKVLQNAEHPAKTGIDPMAFYTFYPRMQSFLFEENLWGALSCLVAIIGAAYLVRSDSLFKRYLLVFLATLGMICSISRGAMMTFCIATVVLLLHSGKHRGRICAILAVFVALGGIGLIILKDTPLVSVILHRFDAISLNAVRKGEVANDRTHQWESGWKIFVYNPSGKGLGAAGYAASLSKMSDFVVGDSVYVRVLSEQGVPGVIALAYLLLSVPWILWRYRNIAPEEWRPLGKGLFAFHLGFCVQGVGANTLDYYCVTPVFFMLFGIYVSAAHRQMRETRQQDGTAREGAGGGTAKMLEAYHAIARQS